MDYDRDDELLDWELQADENFDDVLTDDKQNLQRMTRTEFNQIADEESQATSPMNWVTFGQQHTVERRSGDGDSISSHDQAKYLKDETERHEGATFVKKNEQSTRINSFSNYAAKLEENGESRFTILNEDEADIADFDPSPMKFRGTLTTGSGSYKSNNSCFCKAFRYLCVALLALALGIIIGYYMGRSFTDINDVKVTSPTPTIIPTSKELLNIPTSSPTNVSTTTTATTTSLTATEKGAIIITEIISNTTNT